MQPPCLVTGASGFIGRALCAQLANAGRAFAATSRRAATLPGGSPIHAMDLMAPSVERLAGIGTVVHLAGVAHQHAAPAVYSQVNVDATLALARASQAAGVHRFIYFSSVKAMGPSPGPAPRAEGDLTLPVDAYGRSKREAELALAQVCAGGSMDLIVLRPCLVYGEAPKANLRLLAQLSRYWALRPPEGGQRSMVSLPDLVALVMLLLDGAPAGTHTWIVADERPNSARGMYDALRSARGLAPGRQCLPRALWRLACHCVDRLRGEVGGSTAGKLFAAETYDASALRKATGWRAQQSFADVAASLVSGR
ncbi:NAD-dependent epimerase/dehydratase family protein [Parahaliea mediterranea]|uniref:NAD-dependent epimerase/dehydratase family protein n=1 Tax=Parahaliea mediterranea TaxID=651086 RepID=UPI00130074FE|nr:NAD-dependent epimerase/dehydratase family protein [Parahaliea mediterranea]